MSTTDSETSTIRRVVMDGPCVKMSLIRHSGLQVSVTQAGILPLSGRYSSVTGLLFSNYSARLLIAGYSFSNGAGYEITQAVFCRSLHAGEQQGFLHVRRHTPGQPLAQATLSQAHLVAQAPHLRVAPAATVWSS